VEVTETQLRNLTDDTDVLEMVYTPAYYAIRQLASAVLGLSHSSTPRSHDRSRTLKACVTT
jgi:hypothetical protein